MAQTDNNKPKWREWLAPFIGNGDQLGESAQIEDLLKDAAVRELVDPDTVKIIYGALQVSDMRARDIMVPRANIAYVAFNASSEEILQTVSENPHSRFPVIGTDLDDVRGILHAKDLLGSLHIENKTNGLVLEDIIRPAKVIPESKRLNVLLKDFRSARQHMAIVVDEYTSVAGLITIEDVLEQIVGDIEDEHDPADDEDLIVKLDDGTFRVKGETPIGEFNEYFHVNFTTNEFDTIGGIVTNRFGHVPAPNEFMEIDGFVYTVLNADNRRVDLLHLTAVER